MPGFEIFGDQERAQVQQVLDTGVLFRYGFDSARQGHWKAQEFETLLARRLAVAHCHLCSSGTAALHIALAACGIGAGDEVIVPPFTFIATIEAVLAAGAVPVFAEIDDTLCLDPTALDAAKTARTRAVVAVHMCGAMARIDQIAKWCRQRDVVLIEDACQALGGSYHGQALGTFGRAGCFSFDAVKTITCGEGGAVVTNDTDLYHTAFAFADHGHDHVGHDRGLESHRFLGANYRISELNAAVGVAQLQKLDFILEKQRRNQARLKAALTGIPDLQFRNIIDPDGDSATFLTFLMPDLNRARAAAAALATAGMGCFHWYDNNWHYLRQWEHVRHMRFPAAHAVMQIADRPDYRQVRLPQSDGWMQRALSVPIQLSWTDAHVDKLGHDMARAITRAIED